MREKFFCFEGEVSARLSSLPLEPKRFFRYFVHKVVPIQNAYVRKRGITQSKIYGMGVKVNQFIYILVCNYMPNIGS